MAAHAAGAKGAKNYQYIKKNPPPPAFGGRGPGGGGLRPPAFGAAPLNSGHSPISLSKGR